MRWDLRKEVCSSIHRDFSNHLCNYLGKLAEASNSICLPSRCPLCL